MKTILCGFQNPRYSHTRLSLGGLKKRARMRQALADEVLIAIEDSMVESQLDYLVKRLEPLDYALMRMIKDYVPVYHKKVYEEFGHDVGKKILTRLKSRSIISPIRDEETGYGRYDMNEIGFEILKEVDSQDSKDSKKSIQLD